MFNAAIENEMVTYNRIFQKLDELGIFNTNWENKMTDELKSIGLGISLINNRLEILDRNLIKVGQSIALELKSLTYETRAGFLNLKISVQGVNDSINFNNLLTGIQLYQNYKLLKE